MANITFVICFLVNLLTYNYYSMKLLTTFFLPFLGIALFLQPVKAQNGIKGNGIIKTETRDISGFTGVSVGGAFDVFLKEGSQHKVVIEADENLMDIIVTKKENNTLVIKTNAKLRNAKKLNVYITLPKLDHVKASGAADVKGESAFSSRKMSIDVSGASDVHLQVRAEAIVCNQSGASDVVLSGSAEQVGISLSGSSDFRGEDFKAENGKIKASGSSSAYVNLSKSIVANATGSSDIFCKGNPSKTQFHTSGASDIHLR